MDHALHNTKVIVYITNDILVQKIICVFLFAIIILLFSILVMSID